MFKAMRRELSCPAGGAVVSLTSSDLTGQRLMQVLNNANANATLMVMAARLL